MRKSKKILFIIPLLLVPTIINLSTSANAVRCDSSDRYYCLGFKHGAAAAARGDANYCPNDDPDNPNNNQYCYGFSRGYEQQAGDKSSSSSGSNNVNHDNNQENNPLSKVPVIGKLLNDK
jgi:hypothetical protein